MQTKPKITFSPAFFLFWSAMILLEPCVWLGYIAAAMALHEAGHLISILLVGGGVLAVYAVQDLFQKQDLFLWISKSCRNCHKAYSVLQHPE